MAKKITGYLKLQVPAGAANPSPPIGPALGQRGLNIMEFCKQFNAQTQKMEKGYADPGRHHDLSGSLLHLRDEDAAGVLLHQEGGQARKRLEDPGPRQGRHGHQGAGQGDRREEDEGFELRHDRGRHAMVEGSARSMGIEVGE